MHEQMKERIKMNALKHEIYMITVQVRRFPSVKYAVLIFSPHCLG